MKATTKKKDANWGGARDGAGRKPYIAEDKKHMFNITIRVPNDCKRLYEEERKRGVKFSSIMEETIRNLAYSLGIE